MLNRFATLGAALALGATTFSLSASAAPQQPVSTAEQQAQKAERKEPREPHPEIRKAIGSLQRAKYDLQHAAHDFGGHRVAAIAACDNAIAQLKLALQYDKR